MEVGVKVMFVKLWSGSNMNGRAAEGYYFFNSNSIRRTKNHRKQREQATYLKCIVEARWVHQTSAEDLQSQLFHSMSLHLLLTHCHGVTTMWVHQDLMATIVEVQDFGRPQVPVAHRTFHFQIGAHHPGHLGRVCQHCLQHRPRRPSVCGAHVTAAKGRRRRREQSLLSN